MPHSFALFVLVALTGGQSIDPQVFVPDKTATLPPPPPQSRSTMPAGAIAVSPDGKSWVASVDGKRRGINFSLGSRHVIRGHGLKGAESAWIMGRRMIFQGMHHVNRGWTTGSVLTLDVKSDDEVVATVTQIRGGEKPWSSTNQGAYPNLTLVLRVAGGGQTITVPLPASSFQCAKGEPNCE